ncbi:MAG TPA: DUF3667 domain-containing protein [Chitinophagaceae bacterium]
MSHSSQRKEKDCLNCGTIVQGKYCHVCGQENVEPKESFWHMVTHFSYDITHFDSKFFETMKDLLFKPGFLSKEYMIGRRASYLHPVKMYVFTSALFFLLFFSLFKGENAISTNANQPISLREREAAISELKELLVKDTANKLLREGILLLEDTSKPITAKEVLAYYGDKHNFLNIGGIKYRSQTEYDSVQQSLPVSNRDGWFMRRLVKKTIQINEKYRENPEEAFKKLGDGVLHRLPYMLFVSLPLFALLLKLAYWRRKQFYYTDHAVFAIHLYIFSFIVLTAVFALDKLDDMIHSNFIGVVMGILFLMLFFYLYKAMRKFYGQKRGKTFLKFLLLSFFSIIMMIVLFGFFLFFSAFTL